MLLVPLAFAADLRFVVVGDTQAESGDSVNLDVVPTLVEDMNTLAPDLAIFAGEIIGGVGGGWQGYDPVRETNLGVGFILVEVSGDVVTASYYRDEDDDGHYDDVADQFELTYARTRARGLVAWYAMDSDLSDEAPTDIGYGIDARPLGDAAIATDPERGSVLRLDGAGDAAETATIDAYQLSLKGDLTISLWARAEDLGGGSWDNALVAYATNDYYTEDEETNYAYWLSMRSDGQLLAFWEWGDGNNVELESTEPVPTDGAWHHIALVRDTATRAVTFYVDGTQLGVPVPFSRLPSGASRGYLYPGADTIDNGGSYWSGALDDLCLFDRVLTPTELADVYTAGSCTMHAEREEADTGDTDIGDSADSEDTEDVGEGLDSAQAGEGKQEESGCGCARGNAAMGALPPAWLLVRRRRGSELGARG